MVFSTDCAIGNNDFVVKYWLFMRKITFIHTVRFLGRLRAHSNPTLPDSRFDKSPKDRTIINDRILVINAWHVLEEKSTFRPSRRGAYTSTQVHVHAYEYVPVTVRSKVTLDSDHKKLLRYCQTTHLVSCSNPCGLRPFDLIKSVLNLQDEQVAPSFHYSRPVIGPTWGWKEQQTDWLGRKT